MRYSSFLVIVFIFASSLVAACDSNEEDGLEQIIGDWIGINEVASGVDVYIRISINSMTVVVNVNSNVTCQSESIEHYDAESNKMTFDSGKEPNFFVWRSGENLIIDDNGTMSTYAKAVSIPSCLD